MDDDGITGGKSGEHLDRRRIVTSHLDGALLHPVLIVQHRHPRRAVSSRGLGLRALPILALVGEQ
jgi:hypothetical protein